MTVQTDGTTLYDALLYLILMIIAARAGGEAAIRMRQPAVFGEIIAGVALGLVPVMRPAVESEAIIFIAEIGVIILLFEVGLESKFADFLRVGTPAALVALVGVALPLAIGFGASFALGYSASVALFLGATLTATSVGITARIFKDLRQSQTQEAKIVIGAAVVDDILGLIVLSVVLGIATGAAVSAGFVSLRVGLAVAFLVAAIVIGLRAAPFLIAVAQRMQAGGALIVTSFAFALVLAYLGHSLGLAAIVGAFAAGLILASTEARVHIVEHLSPLANVFTPVFFTLVGMQVNIRLLNPAEPENWPVLLLAAVLLTVAVPTKLLAGFGASRQDVDRLAVGIAMVPRGEVGLIFASLGLQNGILDRGVYGAIVLVVLVTTLITPPWLKARLSQVPAELQPETKE
ncbi:MAG: cation:proton antiporter [Armatimonadetes bacterium]|nr:cation:proton antiporter [Armatimonadota bacterium]